MKKVLVFLVLLLAVSLFSNYFVNESWAWCRHCWPPIWPKPKPKPTLWPEPTSRPSPSPTPALIPSPTPTVFLPPTPEATITPSPIFLLTPTPTPVPEPTATPTQIPVEPTSTPAPTATPTPEPAEEIAVGAPAAPEPTAEVGLPEEVLGVTVLADTSSFDRESLELVIFTLGCLCLGSGINLLSSRKSVLSPLVKN